MRAIIKFCCLHLSVGQCGTGDTIHLVNFLQLQFKEIIKDVAVAENHTLFVTGINLLMI